MILDLVYITVAECKVLGIGGPYDNDDDNDDHQHDHDHDYNIDGGRDCGAGERGRRVGR